MENNHLVDDTGELKRPCVLRDIKKNFNKHKWNDQLLSFITWQYDLANYWGLLTPALQAQCLLRVIVQYPDLH